MSPRTTASGGTSRHGAAGLAARPAAHPAAHRRPSARRPPARRPRLLLGAAAAGAVLVNYLVGPEPTVLTEAAAQGEIGVAWQLGLTAQSGPADPTPDLRPLEELAAGRSARAAAETAAQQAQAAADQAVLDRQQAAAEAARLAAEAAAMAEQQAAEAAAVAAARRAEPEAEAPTAAAAGPASAVATISNSSGPIKPPAQAAANAVVSNVPGAAGITLGGTRPSATDPGGHPSGLAVDYMCLGDEALGDAIAQYHIDHWDALGVDYVIWQQQILSSPGGSWQPMEDRGGTTANHYDHVHVNYRG
jgi:hypothetical protein